MAIGDLFRRLARLVGRDRATADLEDEMRLHLDLLAGKLEGRGLQPTEARYAARRKFGNRTYAQEQSRDMWGFDWIDQAAADVRFAFRRLTKRPAFAASTIIVAALGIGATTAVFSAVDAAILRPLPFHRSEELVALSSLRLPFDPGPGFPRRPDAVHMLDLNDVRQWKELFAQVAAYAAGGLNLEDAERPRRIRVGVVTDNFFGTLGVNPAAGRAFSPAEGEPGGPKAAIISDALWTSQFGRADVVGRTIRLHRNSYRIVGVMPAGFSFPSESDAWITMSVPTTMETFAAFRGYVPSTVIARLASGVTPERADRILMQKWEQGAPRSAKPDDWNSSIYGNVLMQVRANGAVRPLQENLVGGRRKAFLILLGATVLLLLIAAANVANLLLSDGASRRREIALREVLGATRHRVVRQLLIESIILALAGAALGVMLAPATLGLLRTLTPETLVGTAPIHIDLRVLLFAAGLAMVTGTVFGVWPAYGTSRVDPGEAIKAGGSHGSTSGTLGRTRRVLIAAELSLTVMLLVGAGLMLKSFRHMMTQDPGMITDRTGTLEMTFAEAGSKAVVQRQRDLVHQILDRLRSDPAIEAAGVVNDLPLRNGGGIGGISVQITADGMPAPKEDAYPRYLIADGGYFKAMGIPVLMGRVFDATDGPDAHPAVISREMARVFWPGVANPVGRTFTMGTGAGNGPPFTIVGVVDDVREGRLDGGLQPEMYFSMEQQGLSSLGLVARSGLPPGELLKRMQTAVRQVAPGQAVYNVRTMNEVLSRSIAPRRTNTALIAVFGALALVLSAFGVYAVVSYSVAQRSREFGIRSALGASGYDILGLLGREMTSVIGVGLVIGLVAAWALAKVISSMLYGVEIHDPWVYAIVPLVLMAPAFVATLVPATRAMKVSPTEVMRAE